MAVKRSSVHAFKTTLSVFLTGSISSASGKSMRAGERVTYLSIFDRALASQLLPRSASFTVFPALSCILVLPVIFLPSLLLFLPSSRWLLMISFGLLSAFCLKADQAESQSFGGCHSPEWNGPRVFSMRDKLSRHKEPHAWRKPWLAELWLETLIVSFLELPRLLQTEYHASRWKINRRDTKLL